MDFKDEQELNEAFVNEITAHACDVITIRLEGEALHLIGILGIMQLALRHPGLADLPATADFAKWARLIEQRLAEFGPATARICSMGWSPENDARSDCDKN